MIRMVSKLNNSSTRWCFLLYAVWSTSPPLGVKSYSQVATNQNGPKVYKAVNMDLVFPRSFNSSDNSSTTPRAMASVFSVENLELNVKKESATTTTKTTISSTSVDTSSESQSFSPLETSGRAVNYQTHYPFNQLISTKTKPAVLSSSPGNAVTLSSRHRLGSPVEKSSAIQYSNGYQPSPIPSSAEINKLNGQADFEDRFTPGEAVASNQFLKNGAQSASYEETYTPPKNLYSFPPNINQNYPPPSEISIEPPSSDESITSYLPPPSGPLDTSNKGFPGPVNVDNIPPQMNKPTMAKPENDYIANIGFMDNIGVLPASAMQDTNDHRFDPMSESKENNEDNHPKTHEMTDFNDFNQIHGLRPYDTGKVYPTPPPGWMEEQIEEDHPHHDNSPHDYAIYDDKPKHHSESEMFYSDHKHKTHPTHSHSFDQIYPEIIYDDHDNHQMELSTTEMPQEARVKKYSYFYIGRKLWYIPLYFTVWFSFYVLWLIIKSIARHKVNLPNHYVAKRSVLENYTHQEASRNIDRLTASVMEEIDKFKQKYL